MSPETGGKVSSAMAERVKVTLSKREHDLLTQWATRRGNSEAGALREAIELYDSLCAVQEQSGDDSTLRAFVAKLLVRSR